MAELLVPIRTSKTTKPLIIEEISEESKPAKSKKIHSTSEAFQILKDEPNLQSVRSVVKYFGKITSSSSLHIPSPTTTQIVNILITDVVPNYWTQITERGEHELLKALVKCLSGLPPLGAILTRLKALISESKLGLNRQTKSLFLESNFRCLFDLLASILRDGFVSSAWTDIQAYDGAQTRKELIWKELVFLLGSGRIPAVVSEAEECVGKFSDYNEKLWMGNGAQYAGWLAKNIASMMSEDANNEHKAAACGTLLGRSFSIGYTDVVVHEFILNLDQANAITLLGRASKHLRPYEASTFFNTMLRLLDKRFVFMSDPYSINPPNSNISGVSGFLKSLISSNQFWADILVDIISKPESSGGLISPDLLQAAFGAISNDRIRTMTLLETSFRRFCDELSITHSPVLHQEFNVMLLMLLCGHFSRYESSRLKALGRSSEFINSISKHLASTSSRVKWLGMIVATGLSTIFDNQRTVLNFNDKSLNTEEARWYLSLLQIETTPSKSFQLQTFFKETNTASHVSKRKSLDVSQRNTKTQKKASQDKQKKKQPGSGIIQVVDDDDDLVAYAKPDSDPEDEDEDPTLVDRDMPKPPVYIRDLVTGLREQENFNKHFIALSEAASLIRRKAGYGKEVLDSKEELASVLMNLNDNFEIENFATLKQEALIALLLADPATMAKRYARALFGGDYSLQQRLSLLASIGLGARELAGYKDEGWVEQPSFPSKQLPKRLHDIYTGASQLNQVASQLEQSIVQPLAMKAADEIAGPNALKVRTFSSRLEVERTRKKPEANKLAKVVADSFFMPLTGGWWMNQSSSEKGILSMHEFVSTYLRTLAIILDASGPWTIQLPQMTSEFWDLLLSIRSRAFANREYDVLESLLFGLLILLEVNSENKERIAREQAKELVETQEWARLLLDRLDSNDAQGSKIHALAAAVLFRCGEIVEKWQRFMVGDMIDV